jgi:hypothetical protein
MSNESSVTVKFGELRIPKSLVKWRRPKTTGYMGIPSDIGRLFTIYSATVDFPNCLAKLKG